MSKNFLIPRLNLYTRKLSMWQEKLWNSIIPRSFDERWPTDEFRFCYNAYGMRSNKHFLFDHQVGSVNIQKMTAACVWNASNAIPTGPALDTTVTIGNTVYSNTTTSMGGESWRAYGYASGVDYLNLSNFGSIGSATYTDGGSNSRTISAIYYTELGAPTTHDDDLFFCLNATSISDSDTTFVSIDYNSVNYTRASATYSATTGSCSTWRWLNINPNGPITGTPALVVNI